MLRRSLLAAAVVYMYYVHLPLLRLLGPRLAVCASAGLGRLHGLLTALGLDVGGEKKALPVLEELLPAFRPDLGARSVLRRSLLLKHRTFVEYGLAPTARGRRYLERTYHFEGREHLDAPVKEGRGAVCLVFHFGMAQVVFPVLRLAGYDVLWHFARAVPYVEGMPAWARRLAVRAATASDKDSGPILYHYPNYVFPVLARRLKRGGLVGMNGDGMGSLDFDEVPFLGGTLRLPTGPARLAAHTGAAVVPLFLLPEGLGRHRVVVHPPLSCPRDAADSVRETMTAYAALLERHVRERPWAWWIWKQLVVERHEDGRPRLRIRAALPAKAAAAYESFRPGAAGAAKGAG